MALLAYLKGQKEVAEEARARKFGRKSISGRTPTERERTILRTFRTNLETSLAELGRVFGVSETTAAGLVKNLIIPGYLHREERHVYVVEPAKNGRGS